MPEHHDLLILIADGEHARFVRPAADHALHTQEAIDSPAAHQRSADLGSDRPGAAFHSTSTAHHAVAPRHDPHDLAKEHFAKDLAARLNQAAAQDAFAALVLVAPPHTLATIQAGLDATARGRVVGALDKDLVKTPDHELGPHLRDWVRPVHRRH